jgi:phosphoglucosamine mutase
MVANKKYFGTDGIRSRVNNSPLTVDFIIKLGWVLGSRLIGFQGGRVLVARDTRVSGDMMQSALVAGLMSSGVTVVDGGVQPTPAVSYLTHTMGFDMGVMVSASHNSSEYNGFKFFGSNGYKFSDAQEIEVETYLDKDTNIANVDADTGSLSCQYDSIQRYVKYVQQCFPRLNLQGIRVVIDCANGSGYKIIPLIFSELGADVVPIGVSPDGRNINEECGWSCPDMCCAAVRACGAHAGFVFDGDADRLLIVDEKGNHFDGDHILALILNACLRTEELRGQGVVATVASNMGLEKYVECKGLHLHRTQIGDRFVVEKMCETGCNLGGEQSGHIIVSDFSLIGDALIAALYVISELIVANKPASEVFSSFESYPQIKKNLSYESFMSSPLRSLRMQKAIHEAESILGHKGRLLVRNSGTEPVVRLMVEGEDPCLIKSVMDTLVDEMETCLSQTAA